MKILGNPRPLAVSSLVHVGPESGCLPWPFGLGAKRFLFTFRKTAQTDKLDVKIHRKAVQAGLLDVKIHRLAPNYI